MNIRLYNYRSALRKHNYAWNDLLLESVQPLIPDMFFRVFIVQSVSKGAYIKSRVEFEYTYILVFHVCRSIANRKIEVM
jgi:hypothetical protein